jgi:hypothetical protein
VNDLSSTTAEESPLGDPGALAGAPRQFIELWVNSPCSIIISKAEVLNAAIVLPAAGGATPSGRAGRGTGADSTDGHPLVLAFRQRRDWPQRSAPSAHSSRCAAVASRSPLAHVRKCPPRPSRVSMNAKGVPRPSSERRAGGRALPAPTNGIPAPTSRRWRPHQAEGTKSTSSDRCSDPAGGDPLSSIGLS